MTIQRIVEYILHTPHNTNRAILESLLEELIIYHGGSLTPGEPGQPGIDVIYDGGVEQ